MLRKSSPRRKRSRTPTARRGRRLTSERQPRQQEQTQQDKLNRHEDEHNIVEEAEQDDFGMVDEAE